MKYALVTFGCRVNQADSLRLEDALLRRGGVPAPADEAEVVFVNSCSVTATADQGTRQTIRRLTRLNPGARVVVTGCYATRAPEELAALPGVVRVVPNHAKDDLVEALAVELDLGTAEPGPVTLARDDTGDGPCGAVLAPGAAGRTVLTLRVQTGCDAVCSYCIIPTTRGASRSVPPDEVLARVRGGVRAGYKEIVLTGVHLGSYGRDLRTPVALSDLLERLAVEFGDVLFRVSSLEPMDCTPALVDLLATAGCFAPHLHLPLQHASATMLSAMRRPYTIDDYAALVDRVRRSMPHAAIGTDVIVGFPGEREDDAEELADYLRSSPLTHVHVFPYSDRPGTAASSLPGKVHGTLVRERGLRIRQLAADLSLRFRQSQVGAIRPALTVDDGASAVTDNYLKVAIPPGHIRNERVRVRIDRVDPTASGTVQ